MFLDFFSHDHLCFVLIFCDYFGWQGFRVCMYACAHVFPPYFSWMPPNSHLFKVDTFVFVGIVVMMEPILKMEHHHGIADRQVYWHGYGNKKPPAPGNLIAIGWSRTHTKDSI
jgi:hypothetical protein